jgi:hypothetical protein
MFQFCEQRRMSPATNRYLLFQRLHAGTISLVGPFLALDGTAVPSTVFQTFHGKPYLEG